MIHSPRSLIAGKIIEKKADLAEWFRSQCKNVALPFYCSMDIRDSGFKIAPVDCNLYPAGFNNLCEADLKTAPALFRQETQTRIGANQALEKVLILPENNTTNAGYIDNLATLKRILEAGGFSVQIGWYDPTQELSRPMQLIPTRGDPLIAHPMVFKDDTVSAGGFTPDWILLNNDFSSGYPMLLDTISQPILPSHVMGWHTRQKGRHFEHYNHLASELSTKLSLDPRLIQVFTEKVDGVNFNDEIGIDRVAESVSRVLKQTAEFYKEYKIDQTPFVFVKSNVGTYGMGILTLKDPKELFGVNRRTKNKMSVGKNRIAVTSVVVQEGIPTTLKLGTGSAEPVIYLCGSNLIGGFIRSHPELGPEENLNSSGMVFKKICTTDLEKVLRSEGDATATAHEIELVYGTIARLAAIATGYEISEASTHPRDVKPN